MCCRARSCRYLVEFKITDLPIHLFISLFQCDIAFFLGNQNYLYLNVGSEFKKVETNKR